MRFHLILSLLALPIVTSTAPTNVNPNNNNNEDAYTITTSQILAIAPKSHNCTAPPAKGECATASQAAPNIAKSFAKYGVSSRAEQAAVIALMAFESGEFRYSRNHFPGPGVVGKGTRNMQSPTYNNKYAHSIPLIADKVRQAGNDKGQLLDLLLADKEYDFGSGAWFLVSQCSDVVRESLKERGEEGWEGYVKDCVGTEANEERRGYWKRAVEVLG